VQLGDTKAKYSVDQYCKWLVLVVLTRKISSTLSKQDFLVIWSISKVRLK
jgi:hypothetical protein